MSSSARPPAAARPRTLRAIALPSIGLLIAALAACSSSSAGASWTGADPAEVAKAAGCTGVTNATQAPAAAPVQFRSVLCAFDNKPVAIQTYQSVEDQAAAETKALPSLGRGLPKGTYYYASGTGWLAEDTSAYSEQVAKDLVAQLGGKVRSFEGAAG